MRHHSITSSLLALVVTAHGACPDYSDYSKQIHEPTSNGVYSLSYQRPDPACRTFNSSIVEATITRIAAQITDPDLQRLFVNAYPNTLDTAIKWKGYAANSADEELTFVITGDINAMWLRDSANQMQSYLPLLEASDDPDSLASLYRGVINVQSRYILSNAYCNSFQPPVESGIEPSINGAATHDTVVPPYSNQTVFECKYELDSLAAFLEISTNYYTATKDALFFRKYNWLATIQRILEVADAMQVPTYASNGSVNHLAYSFTRLTTRATETTENSGLGYPFAGSTGLIRSFFRPSDDATIFQGFVPANMMFARYLETTAPIVDTLVPHRATLSARMRRMAMGIRNGIKNHAVLATSSHGQVYAYEIDGHMSANVMDDANIPSLLSAPVFGFLNRSDEIYQNTRRMLLTSRNPYYMFGPVIEAIGGPHDGPGYAWPMASIVRVLTSDDDKEIVQQLFELVSSTDRLGLIHESINTFNASDWTRQWFSWANGLFGQMILDLADRKPQVLAHSFQPSS